MGASPSWPRRRILIPVTAGSSPAAPTNSSRGLGREGAGSHKAGMAGSTPVPATISGGSGTGKTGCVRRSSAAQLARHPAFENECVALQRQNVPMSCSSNSVVPDGVSEALRMLVGFSFGIVTRRP